MARLRENLLSLEMTRSGLQQELSAVYASTSWRITQPLRYLLTKARGAKRRLRNTRLFARLSARYKGLEPPREPDLRALKQAHDRATQAALDHFLTAGAVLAFPSAPKPKVSVILVVYNRAALTFACLTSLLAEAAVGLEVIIVDNHSTDETAALLERLRHVTIMHNAENVGFVKAVNQGVAQAQGDHVLLLNNDAIVHPGSLWSAVSTLEGEPGTGAVGGKIMLLDGTLQEAGSVIFNDGSCQAYGRHGDPDAAEFTYRRPVDFCSGAFLLIKRALFEAFGGLDEDYAPAYYEEVDFCLKLKNAGHQVLYDPDIRLTHYEFASSASRQDAIALQIRNRRRFVAKNAEALKRQPAPDAPALVFRESPHERPRVLFIDDRVPFGHLGSGFPRTLEMLRGLHRLGVSTTFYPLQFGEARWTDIRRAGLTDVEFVLNQGLAGLGPFLAQRKDLYDFIIVSRPHNKAAFDRALDRLGRDAIRARIIYDAEAIYANRDMLRQASMGRPVNEAQANAALEAELKLAANADRILAVSELEARQFSRFGLGNISVVSHAITPRENTPGFSDRHGLLFVGPLTANETPNADSIVWFVQRVLPILAQRAPQLMLTLVGTSTADSVLALASHNVRIVGKVEDVARHYDSARLFIAPTRFAAGIPLKVLEAAAHGVPIVATSLLATQLGWADGRELLVADDPAAFADKCLTLYHDEALWTSVRRGATRAIAQDYAPAQVQRALQAVLRPVENRA